MSATREDHQSLDVAIVGAGFAGLYMLHRLRGLGLSTRVYEAGEGIGGTWYWNRYPGARCDVESMDYSYSFSDELQQQWSWTERYGSQPEILNYLSHVADRCELRRDIQLRTRVTAAEHGRTAGAGDGEEVREADGGQAQVGAGTGRPLLPQRLAIRSPDVDGEQRARHGIEADGEHDAVQRVGPIARPQAVPGDRLDGGLPDVDQGDVVA